MVKAVLRGLTAVALAVLPSAVSAPVHAADTLPLTDAVASLLVATESRDGYDRDKFRHWNTGDNPADGCNTRVICTTGPGWSTTSLVRGDPNVLTDLRYMRHWGRLRSR